MASKLLQIATLEETTELARNDYSPSKEYSLSTSQSTNLADAGTQTDIVERGKELARNDFSAANPYSFSSL